MKKVLVTGSTGFVGSYLLKILPKELETVRVLVRKKIPLSKQVDIFQGDLTQKLSLHSVCHQIDTVFHFAGLAHSNNTNLVQHLNVNFLGTKNLMECAVAEGVQRFIYLSSVKAGDQTPYGKAKKQAEEFLLEMGRDAGMHVCVLRPALVYGPYWKGNLAAMLRAVDKGYFPPLPETHNKRSLVSVHDVCHAALLAAMNPIANQKVYTITDGKPYSTRQLYNDMLQALNKKIPSWHIPLMIVKLLGVVRPAIVDKLVGSAYYEDKRVEDELDYKPLFDFRTMLPEIIAAYQRNEPC